MPHNPRFHVTYNSLFNSLTVPVPVRVLMVARSVLAWPAVAGMLAEREAATSDMVLKPVPDDPGARDRMFCTARDRFAELYERPDALQVRPPIALGHPDYGLTLTLHMAALVAVDAHVHGHRTPAEAAGLSAYLLEREEKHGMRLDENRADAAAQVGEGGLPYSTTPDVMRQAVFAAALTGPTSHQRGKALIGTLDLERHPHRILTDHATCYPPADPTAGTVLEPLYPDRLAEDFLALALPGHPITGHPADSWTSGAVTSLLARGTDDDPPVYMPRAVTFLAAAAERWPHVAERHLGLILRRAPQLAIDAGSNALASLARTVDIDVLESIERRIPDGGQPDLDVGIAAIATRLAEHRLAHLPASAHAERARIHRLLAVHLDRAGSWDRAMQHSSESVAAARAAGDSFLLAQTLLNQGDSQCKVGQASEAVATLEEAVAIFRVATQFDPETVGPLLASAYNNLANSYEQAGNPQKALTAIQNAVSIRTPLAQPGAHDQIVSLAQHLAFEGTIQGKLNRLDEALAAAQVSVYLLDGLAREGHPVDADLAMALNGLSIQYQKLGHQAEALPPIQRAIEIRELLAQVNPHAYENDLARSLTNLGICLKDLDRSGDAVQAHSLALEIRERLVAQNSEAYGRSYGITLVNLVGALNEAGHFDQGATAGLQAISLLHALKRATSAFVDDLLAVAYSNAASSHSELDEWHRAAALAEQGFLIMQNLANANPQAYSSRFREIAENYATALEHAGRRDDAATVQRTLRTPRWQRLARRLRGTPH